MIESMMSCTISCDSASRVSGLILPCTLIQGGAPTVTNRSDPSEAWSLLSQSWMVFIASPCGQQAPWSGQGRFVLGLAQRFLARDHAASHQLNQRLVKRGHADILSGL